MANFTQKYLSELKEIIQLRTLIRNLDDGIDIPTEFSDYIDKAIDEKVYLICESEGLNN